MVTSYTIPAFKGLDKILDLVLAVVGLLFCYSFDWYDLIGSAKGAWRTRFPMFSICLGATKATCRCWEAFSDWSGAFFPCVYRVYLVPDH